MKVSLNWLSDHLDLGGKTAAELSDLLTFSGIEVEGIQERGLRNPHIVIAQVQSFVPHPNADKLRLCQVDDGSGTPRQIVCGAKNFSPGDKVPLALPGAKMPGGFEIKESKLRGELSQGMMCSGDELGLPSEEDGLMLLGADAPVGRPLSDLVESDTIFELEITPNRPDCLSHQGVARELAALTDLPLKKGRTYGASTETLSSDSISLHDEGCPYYTARTIRGVKIGPSPEWLKKKLTSIGLRSINNVVDITNYVLMEMGQPLHSFDLNQLNGCLHVRAATAGETFLALDEKSYPLTTDDLVIADDQGPVALAGVMGGLHSGVSDATTDILLESAYFHPDRVRHTSRRLGLISDSSYRFERGVDAEQILAASDLATRLILEIAGGTAEPTVEVAGVQPKLTADVTLDLNRCRSLIGVELPEATCVSILEKLGLVGKTDQPLTFTIPGYRQDLVRPVDLIEEVARIYGIDNVPGQRTGVFSLESAADMAYDALAKLKSALVGAGFYEAQTIKLISAEQLSQVLGTNPGPLEAVAVKNPLSEDHTHLRPSLVPGLISSAARNLSKGTATLRLFESGTVFARGKKPEPEEKSNIALLVSGPAKESTWAEGNPAAADFYELRGVVEMLVPGSAVKIKSTRKAGELLLPSQILVNGKPVGLCGQLRPGKVKAMDGRHALYLAELNVEMLLKAAARDVRFADMPKFPGSTRDVALGVTQIVTHAQFEDFFAAQQNKEPLLESVRIFDVYQGDKVAEGTKSVAYRLSYRDPNATMEAAAVDAVHQRVIIALKAALPVTVR